MVIDSNPSTATYYFLQSENDMVYNLDLEFRIDGMASRFPRLDKRKMFGGIGYILNGNMSFGIYKDYLIVRTSSEIAEELLKREDVKPFDITGKAMKGWVMVSPDYVETNDELFSILKTSIDFAENLPRK